jgi:hypothetical protein
VYSVEHDVTWADKVRKSLDDLGISNCELRYIGGRPNPVPPDTDDSSYGSMCEGWEDYTFRNYVTSIEEHRDRSLDLVLIDGRAREACLRHALTKVRPGGMLVLDNSERPRYQAALSDVPTGWSRLDFPGPSARADFFSRTTIWIVSEETASTGAESEA